MFWKKKKQSNTSTVFEIITSISIINNKTDKRYTYSIEENDFSLSYNVYLKGDRSYIEILKEKNVFSKKKIMGTFFDFSICEIKREIIDTDKEKAFRERNLKLAGLAQ